MASYCAYVFSCLFSTLRFVRADDLVTILTYWGQADTTRRQGDLTGDAFVGADDYVEVLTNWGSGARPETIPEPAVGYS